MMQRRAIVILFVTLFLVMLSFGIIIPNLAFLAEDRHATESQVGWLMATYSLCQFLFSPLWGAFSDRRGRRPAILIGLAGNAVGLVLFGLAGTLPMLFVARAISGTLTAAALPTCMAYVADITDEASRGKGMGLMGAAMGLGFILGPPVGGLLGHFGHDVPFLVAAGLTALTFGFALAFLRESLRPGSAPAHRRRLLSPLRILREPLAPFFVLAFFVTLTMSGLETTFPFLVQQELKIGAESLGWMLGIMGLAVTLVQGGLLGRLINRYGEVTVLTGGILVNAAGFFLITSIPRVTGMTFALTVAGVGNQVLRPTNASLISKHASTGQGAAIGTMDSMDALGRVFGPFLAGYLYEVGRTLPYYFGALAMSLVFIGIALSRGSARAKQEP